MASSPSSRSENTQPTTPGNTGAFSDWFNPDLMLGLSGVGYFLLRLKDPDLFESPLLIGYSITAFAS